jgi:hypothetical protein
LVLISVRVTRQQTAGADLASSARQGAGFPWGGA